MSLRTRFRWSFALPLTALIVHAAAWAHGGEEHSHPGDDAAAPVSVAGMQGAVLTSSATTDYFEVVAKYPATDAGEDTRLRLFVADYATNQPIERAGLSLSFRPAGVTITQAPAMISPGIYDVVVRFPADTVYALVATVTSGQRTDFVEVRNLYAGEAADRFLAEHGGAPGATAEEGSSTWVLPLVIGAVVVAGLAAIIVVWRRRRGGPGARLALFLAAIAALGLVMLDRLAAHAGEDHGEAAPAAAASAATGAGLTVMKEQQFALGMLTELVAPREVVGRVAVTGRVVPRTDAIAEVVPGVAGKVVGGRLPQRGERVSKGQVLFRVAQVLSPSERGAIRSEQIRAKAELASAEREVSRLGRLEGVVAGKQITEARIRRDAAREQYTALSAQLSGSDQTVAVTAPISGEITRAEIAAGEVIDGAEVVYEISDPSRIWIEANIFERDLPQLTDATSAEITTPAAPGRVFRGTLHRLAGTVDPETQTVTALFTVDNPGGTLRINMSAQIAVASGARSRSLAIPDAAIVRSGARQVVFVHTAPELFEARDITLGAAAADGYVHVISGVRPGERVLITGTHQMRSIAGL
ncbi:MAG TPA: efflux RND transporter periplasmic adaptor subunit [Candidatus Kapabacteria bacterium]|nr:efflux RND transporter periplasmic adaptor subunit [Candidatus Kapabacteria bacterium]